MTRRYDLTIVQGGSAAPERALARRIAFLVDNQAFFAAAASAMRKAQRSILIIGWMFDPRTMLGGDNAHDPVGPLLRDLAAARPALEIHVLIWNPPLFVSVGRKFMARRAGWRFEGGRVNYHLDRRSPFGASHHQKLLVVDDALAFCGGGDFMPNRWDTPAHPDVSERRRLPSGAPYDPRHEVTAAVDGPAAAALGAVARERWWRATGECLPAPSVSAGPWPDGVEPDLRDQPVRIVRTEPAWTAIAERRDTEAAFLRAVRGARRWLYIECQYFAAAAVTAALAARLAAADAPEVVVVGPPRSPGYFDRWIMDPARARAVARLRDADRHGRFRAYWARAEAGTPIIIHSKVLIADGRLLYVGSANVNNRSMGYDTECGLLFDAGEDSDARAAHVGLLDRLLAEHLGCAPRVFRELRERRGLIAAIGALNYVDGRRLEPIDTTRTGPLGRLIARTQLFDPHNQRDAWRPWRRW